MAELEEEDVVEDDATVLVMMEVLTVARDDGACSVIPEGWEETPSGNSGEKNTMDKNSFAKDEMNIDNYLSSLIRTAGHEPAVLHYCTHSNCLH